MLARALGDSSGGGEACAAVRHPSPVSGVGISRLCDHLGQFAHSAVPLPATPRLHNYCQIAFWLVCFPAAPPHPTSQCGGVSRMSRELQGLNRGEVSHSHPSTSQQRSWQRARWRKTLQLPPPPLSQQSPTSAPAPAVTHTAVPDLTPDELPRRTQPTLVPWRRRAWAGLPPLPAHGAGTKAINQGEPWLRSRAPRRRAAKHAAPCSINESFPKKHLPPSLLGGLLSSTWEYTIAQEKLESPSRSVCI